MKIAYFDCFAGASGDMILGALVDAGLDIDELKSELAKLHLDHYDLQAQKVVKKGIGGSQVHVIIDEHHHGHHHRHLADIEAIINASDLETSVKKSGLEVFNRLARAEASVHRTSVDAIHFHEVGAMDAILDVMGAVAGIHALGIDKVICSPLHLGSGTVACAHGTLPVPAPATAELVKGKPVYASGVQGELLTPTGAAILTTLSADFGPLPAMAVETIGYGAGTSDPALPNLLRVMIGRAAETIKDCDMEQVAVLETNIDDMNPQIYEYIITKVLQMGALDIYITPVQMKKNRTGMLVTLVCAFEKVGQFADFLLRETTTIGLRWRSENRLKAWRRMESMETPYGRINFKIAQVGKETINVAPEYEDCLRAALERKVPLKQVMAEANKIGQTFRQSADQ
ncbi:MAG: nickel pincer cofactor biosynthesis protein LarC [Desulfobacterales bacterium]